MENLVFFAPVLGCLAMAAVMFFMMRGHNSGQPAQPSGTDAEIAQLRAEIAALKAEQAIQTHDRGHTAPAPAEPSQR